jgi:tRNA(fMet)-specific endonuclease VapC
VSDVVLLDTDVFSYLWADRPEASAYRPLVEGRYVALSFTSIAEAHYGAIKRGWGESKRARLEAALRPVLVLPYNRKLAVTWAELRAESEHRGRAMQANDCWIAATAVHYRVPLITNNLSDFDHIPQLKLLTP